MKKKDKILHLILVIILFQSCQIGKENNAKIMHLVPYGYEGTLTMIVTDSIENKINELGFIEVEYKDGLGRLKKQNKIIELEKIVWRKEKDEIIDSLKFVNEGIIAKGLNTTFLVSRLNKPEEELKQELIEFKRENGIITQDDNQIELEEDNKYYKLGPIRKYRIEKGNRYWKNQ